MKMPVAPGHHVVFPASAGVWIEVDEERLLVCGVRELLGQLEEIGICPLCEGKGAPGGDACPVCGRSGDAVHPE